MVVSGTREAPVQTRLSQPVEFRRRARKQRRLLVGGIAGGNPLECVRQPKQVS
jgi:hypothetical protein